MYILIAILVLIAFVTLAILLIRRYAPKFDKGKPLKGILGVILFIALINAAPDALRPVFHFLFDQQLNQIQQEKDAQNIEAMFQEVPFLKKLQTYYPQEAEELKRVATRAWAQVEDPTDSREVAAKFKPVVSKEATKIMRPKFSRASNRSIGEFVFAIFSLVKKRIEDDPRALADQGEKTIGQLVAGHAYDKDEMMNFMDCMGRIVESTVLTPEPPPTKEEAQEAVDRIIEGSGVLSEKYESSLDLLQAVLDKPGLVDELGLEAKVRCVVDLHDIFASRSVDDLGLIFKYLQVSWSL